MPGADILQQSILPVHMSRSPTSDLQTISSAGEKGKIHVIIKQNILRSTSGRQLCAVRKPPLINRGYYTRHRCIQSLMAAFSRLCRETGNGVQVLNLGAGFDTTYWHLKDQVTLIQDAARTLHYICAVV